jgi:Calcineurin-like phosphoesterase
MNRIRFSIIYLLLFFAAVGVGAQEKITIAVWGDSRENLDHACEQIANVLEHQITDWDVQVHTGDFTHHGSEADWQQTLAVPGIKELYVPGKFLLCTSNHDASGTKGDPSASREVYDNHTRGILPINDADGTTHFYAWHKGNVHIVVLDAYFSDSSTVQHWLDKYLEQVKPNDWLIGVWHNPAYEITYKETYLNHCRGWLESLARYGGCFILNGHAHIYARTKPLLPDGTVDNKKGIVHIINGTGGASWKDPVPMSSQIAFTPSVRSFPVITFITFEGRTANLRTIDARPENNLKTIDTYSITH